MCVDPDPRETAGCASTEQLTQKIVRQPRLLEAARKKARNTEVYLNTTKSSRKASTARRARAIETCVVAVKGREPVPAVA